MLIYVGEPYCKLIATQEGAGDNLSAEDIKDGYVDYWLSSIYEQDGEDIKLVDSGQILTSTPIADMEEEERLKRIFGYWEVGDPEDRDTDYVILEREIDMIECEDCGEKWNEQELNSYAWHCLKCGHKIGE